MSGFLSTAELLVGAGARQPSQEDLRRAVSTAYYAVFDALARVGADLLIGERLSRGPEWTQVYRALDHGAARLVCEGLRTSAYSIESERFSRRFVKLQLDRLRADYDPSVDLTRAEALASIADARLAIGALATMNADEQRRLVIAILISRRRR